MSKLLNVHDSQEKSILQLFLSAFVKNDNEEQNRELERYDSIEFIDVSKEISEKGDYSSKKPGVNDKVTVSTKE